tara:strand:- start:44 stop:556 length:513 start_codon:yes stop_codon:yes gene_type:complete
MHRDTSGTILLIVLVYLQLFSLLAMQGLASLGYDRKMAKLQMAQFMHHEDALTVLTVLDRERKVCPGPYSASALIYKPLSWWQEHACYGQFKGQPYYYLHEVLDVDRCVSISGSATPNRAALYYRTTLYYAADVSALVQDTFVTQSQLSPACDHPVKNISAGRQSLRWLR